MITNRLLGYDGDFLNIIHGILTKGEEMLFMTIFTHNPEKREEVIKRRKTGPHVPDSVKILGEWGEIGKHRIFRLVEADDPKLIIKSTMAWSDLGNIEVIPVMETAEIMDLLENA